MPAVSLALSCAEKRVFALLLSWLLSGSQNGESVVPEANSAAMHGYLNNNTPVNTEVLWGGGGLWAGAPCGEDEQ
jgi:hypothetical protein